MSDSIFIDSEEEADHKRRMGVIANAKKHGSKAKTLIGALRYLMERRQRWEAAHQDNG